MWGGVNGKEIVRCRGEDIYYFVEAINKSTKNTGNPALILSASAVVVSVGISALTHIINSSGAYSTHT